MYLWLKFFHIFFIIAWFAGLFYLPRIYVILLAAYHIACRQLLIAFEQQRNRHSHKWYRVFNEIPVFALLAALYLVLFKPF